MLRAHSFPSGHSASAFALFFSLAHITRQRSWEVFWLIMAVAVSYSRVYLSQHFLIDILGGSLIGIIAGILSLIILKRINKPWLEKNLANIIHHAH
jgi:membrane-associated phospholipid phosphatase